MFHISVVNAWQKTLFILSSAVLGFLIIEIVARVLDLSPRPLAPLSIAEYRLSMNPVIGYEYLPGHKAIDDHFDPSHLGFAINRVGFRDYEYTEIKPKNTFRVIILGDSTTAGNGIVDMHKTYAKQVEKLLNANATSRRHYQVLNMGVGGYHTMQEIETLRVKGLKYNPDLVLITFCLNDFDLHSDGGVHRTLLEGSRGPTRTTGTEFYTRLLQISRVAFIIHHRLKYSQTAYEDFYAKNILKGQTTVRAGLALLSELRQRHGFSALVTILPVFVDPFDKYKYMNIHAKVFRAAEGLAGISVIDLLPRFARIDNSAEKFSFDGLHMNEHGHQAMAEILLPIIESRSQELTMN